MYRETCFDKEDIYICIIIYNRKYSFVNYIMIQIHLQKKKIKNK